MKFLRSIVMVSVIALPAMLMTGCGGGDSTLKATTTTMGQELSDLKRAYDQGIISEREYKSSKRKILKRYD